MAVLCRTHAAEEMRCWLVFVLDVELRLAHLTLMNATLHFIMSASWQVCHSVDMDGNKLTSAPFISHVSMLFL